MMQMTGLVLACQSRVWKIFQPGATIAIWHSCLVNEHIWSEECWCFWQYEWNDQHETFLYPSTSSHCCFFTVTSLRKSTYFCHEQNAESFVRHTCGASSSWSTRCHHGQSDKSETGNLTEERALWIIEWLHYRAEEKRQLWVERRWDRDPRRHVKGKQGDGGGLEEERRGSLWR